MYISQWVTHLCDTISQSKKTFPAFLIQKLELSDQHQEQDREAKFQNIKQQIELLHS